MTTTKTGQRLSWLLLSTLLTTAVSANGNNNNYHSNLLASSSSSPSTSSLYSSSSSSSSSPSSSSSSNPGSYYSFPLNIVEAAKVYQSRSSGYSSPAIVNFLQQYQQQQQQQSESLASAVRRSQQDVASLYNQPETINLSPAMQQLASSLLAASAQSVASFESPPSAAAASVDGQQNYSAGLLDAGNAAAFAESAFYSNPSLYNYFLNAQQYYPSDPSAAYTLSPAALEQYTAAFLQAGNGSALGGKHSSVGVVGSQNNKATQMTGVNKQGLGRRIGELVSNSAERASRAFKSFSQFKLFNDIKPSRLLGLVSDQQQQQQSGDGKMLVNSSTASMVASASSPPSAWYFPPSGQVAAGIPVANPWSSAAYGSSQAAPPASPSFYQQPVYVRTQDVGGGGQVAAAAAALAAQKGADYLASMSEFYPQKLSALDGTGAAPFAPSPPNANIALSGSTTVYHHYGPSSLNGGGGRGGGGGNEGGNSQHSDLFAAPQTTFGVRMKPPKDFEFDSNEDELSNSSSEQDDAKMADNGGGGSNGGRNNMDNGGNDGSSSGDRFNERPSNGGGSGNGGGNSGPWSSGSSSFDEFSESNSGVEPDLYNAYNPNVPNNGQRFRPFNTGHSGFRPVIAPNAFQASMPNLRPYMAGIRRPTPMAADFDDSDSWYSTFFGNNIKPMTRLRGVPFANNAPMAAAAAAAFANAQHHQSAAHHHQPHPSLLNSAASTQTPTSLSPDNYFGSAAGAHHHAHHHSPHANYFQAAFNRPVWPGYSTALYPGAASPYFRPNPLLTGAATQMRPVTMPYSPYFMAPRYHHHQAPRPAMYGHAAYPTASPMMMAAARYPTAMSPYSMMPSASTLYPVRVPFSPMMPMANPFAAMAASSLIPTIAQPPIMRYRIGTDLTPSPVSSSSSSSSSPAVSTIRRTLNITKRGNLAGGSSTGNGLDLVDTASSVLSKVGKAIANKLPSVKLSSLSMSGAAAKNEDGAEIIVPNEHEASLATLYNAYQVLQRRMETTEHTQAPSTSSPSENASSRSSQQQQQQQQQSAQPPPPYYHYYIGDKDTYQSTSTTTSTTSTSTSSPLSTVLNSFQDNSGLGFSTEHLDSSARAIPLNFTASSSSSSTGARSIKARHVSEQLAEHEKRQQEIRQFLEGGAEVGVQLTATNGTSTDIPSPTYITPSTTTSSPVITRTAKAVSSGSSGSPQILSAGDNSPWRPLLRSAVVGRKRY